MAYLLEIKVNRKRLFGKIEIQGVADGVDRDAIAVFDDGQRTAVEGFGSDVADHETMGSAGEASVGNQGHVLAQSESHHGGGG